MSREAAPCDDRPNRAAGKATGAVRRPGQLAKGDRGDPLHRGEPRAEKLKEGFPMDPTQIRARYLFLILLAAVLTAALLRHFLHVEGGFTRKQILVGALVAVAIGAIVAAIFSRWRRRR